MTLAKPYRLSFNAFGGIVKWDLPGPRDGGDDWTRSHDIPLSRWRFYVWACGLLALGAVILTVLMCF